GLLRRLRLLAMTRKGRASARLVRRVGRLGFRRRAEQAARFEHRFDPRLTPGEGTVGFEVVLRAAGAEDHLPETVAVGARQAAVLAEPGAAVAVEHLGPQV